MNGQKSLRDPIEISSKAFLFDWGLEELWQSWRLLYLFVWRDFKVRYKQTYLGPAWAVVQPLLMVMMMTFVFGVMAKVNTGDTPYSIYALAGLIPWTLFSATSIRGSGAIQSNAYLMTRVYFPRLILPIAAGGTALIDAVIATAVLAVAMIASGTPIPWSAPLGILALAISCVMGQALAILFCSVVVWFRDLRNILPLLFQIGLFATPVAYPIGAVPSDLRWIAEWNPMTWPVNLFQSAVLGVPFSWLGAWVTVVVFGSLLVVGLVIFRRATRRVVDIW